MSDGTAKPDKREHARFELLEYVLLGGSGGEAPSQAQRAVIVDVSLGGLQVRSRSTFNEGALLRLTIGRAEEEPVAVIAEVRYSIPVEDSDLFATGFRVRPENREQRIEWVDYVHAVFQSQGELLTY
ncbi:MAG: PilZ domain-containing protein [Armatimonadetes bacterium]|nr:PilZ domain-containing protein [Armatimonadota bacterium]